MRVTTALLSAAVCAVGGTAVAQDEPPALNDACRPQGVTFTFTQPTNLSLDDRNAVRWPINGTVRLGYTGAWCPEDGQVKFVELDEAGEEVGEIPAQVRMQMPYLLVENDPEEPESVLEIDPVGLLKPRTDYRVVVSPPNPLTPLYRDYTLEFRTRATEAEGVPDFAGITSAALEGSFCPLEGSPYRPTSGEGECVSPSRLSITVRFTPAAQRADLSYVVYRTAREAIDPETQMVVESEYNTTEEVPVRYVRSSVSGDPSKPPVELQVPVISHYGPLPRRECFSVRMLDDYLRERGDLTNQACVNIISLGNCPEGCELGTPGCSAYPAPILAEIGPPVPGQMCPNLGLAGADPSAPIPAIGEEPGYEADMGVGPATDGGVGGGEDGGGGSCSTGAGQPSALGALGFLLALVGLRRRSLSARR